MPRTLILMRHAKSSWSSAGLADHDRPLNGRGARNAQALGVWLRKNALSPNLVLCSTAARTRATLSALDLTVPVEFDRALYLAGASQIHDRLRRATSHCVLVIGHNPGIAEFAERILVQPPDHPRFQDYPTGATLVASFDSDSWNDIGWRSGQPIDFVIPRELP